MLKPDTQPVDQCDLSKLLDDLSRIGTISSEVLFSFHFLRSRKNRCYKGNQNPEQSQRFDTFSMFEQISTELVHHL